MAQNAGKIAADSDSVIHGLNISHLARAFVVDPIAGRCADDRRDPDRPALGDDEAVRAHEPLYAYTSAELMAFTQAFGALAGETRKLSQQLRIEIPKMQSALP